MEGVFVRKQMGLEWFLNARPLTALNDILLPYQLVLILHGKHNEAV